MSIPVSLVRLREAITDFGSAPYLLTVSDDGRPHSVAVPVTWDGDELVMPVGNRTRANATARPLVSLLWSPRERDGYSLIVDAEVTGAGDGSVVLRPTGAVLHRPAPASDDTSACSSDCIPLSER